MSGPRPGNPPAFDESFEVLVIGSGFAGLSAAIEARLAGRSVLVIEKMALPGGNSALSGGLIAVANAPLLARDGIADSPDLLAEDMFKAGHGLNHPDLVRAAAAGSLEAFLWCRDFLGVVFAGSLHHGGGHSVPRIYSPENCSGSVILQALLVKCRELGIPIRLQTALEAFILDGDGRVAGAEVRAGHIFPQAQSGTPRRIGATRGVVLASGGYCQDIEFRKIHDPGLAGALETTNHPGATAEALVSALKIGATPVHLSWIQMGPWTSRDEVGWGVSTMFSVLVGIPHGIMIDASTGKRFVNELADRLSRSREMVAAGRDPMLIVGGRAARQYPNLAQGLKRGAIRRYDTLEALAQDQSIDFPALEATLRHFNLSLRDGVDDEFGRPLAAHERFPIEAPYHLVRLRPKIHYCNGGIQIDAGARALDIASHRPIPGLYAAGEVTGGVHGACRLGGMAITECIVFGRTAGVNASRAKD
ncbi:flavocytochrome c [Mesoterricola silvestris]|uniref:Flavocytochrome c n=1 Tax=Mesoterricola silvestris TaxID=2927979 RepID=A0AA48K831_9BACT|nr:flavocytochrome c [Mesoterricola silvestris]BDU72529.1 flavocytochrome c [Mesoterricola silvestris]